MDEYTIYLVNEGSDTQTFWVFLAEPDELKGDPSVFANSAAAIAVKPNYMGKTSVTIPVQYSVGAGASNAAVGLAIKIQTDVVQNAELGQKWTAQYATVLPRTGPELSVETGAPEETIQIITSSFNKTKNENAEWFSSQSFGIETDVGFIGMTWSPSPSMKRTITPKLTFYVTVGDFGENQMAAWTDVSTATQTVSVPKDFRRAKATVTYDSSGQWSVRPGTPKLTDLLPQTLSDAGKLLNADDLEMAALTYVSLLEDQSDDVAGVVWDASTPELASRPPGMEEGGTLLSGTLTVKTALAAAFTYFVLSGITFSISKAAKGDKTFKFSYSGPKSAAAVKELFTVGATIHLGPGRSEA